MTSYARRDRSVTDTSSRSCEPPPTSRSTGAATRDAQTANSTALSYTLRSVGRCLPLVVQVLAEHPRSGITTPQEA